MDVEKKFLQAVSDFSLISQGDKILLAYSTGVDSSVLLHLLMKFKNYFKVSEIAIAYFNHSLRPQADREEEFTKEISKNLKIKAFTKKEDVKKFAKENRLSLEEAGRVLRYNFFTEILQKEGFNKLATAHHLSDLTENLVMWFLQGSKKGLQGFKPKEGKIIRPMIYISKEEIKSYAQKYSIRFFEDETNEDTSILRNKVRKEVIPVLKSVNPSLESSLFTLSQFSQIDEQFFESYLKRFDSLIKSEKILLRDLPEEDAVIYRVIDKWLLEIHNIKPSYRQLLEILKLLKRKKEFSFYLKEDKRLFFDGEYIYVDKQEKKASFEYKIYPDSEVFIKELNLKVRCYTIENAENVDKFKYSKDRVCFEFTKEMNEGFTIRPRKEGDRFIPFGRKSEKKLKDVLIDLKIPKSYRNLVPLLVFQDKILWIIGHKRSSHFPLTESSKKIICFEAKEVESASS